MRNKEINYYMNLPYNYIIQPINDESGNYFYGKVMELDGCQSTGNNFEETYLNLREAMEGYIETKLENGFNIPKPLQNKIQ